MSKEFTKWFWGERKKRVEEIMEKHEEVQVEERVLLGALEWRHALIFKDHHGG